MPIKVRVLHVSRARGSCGLRTAKKKTSDASPSVVRGDCMPEKYAVEHDTIVSRRQPTATPKSRRCGEVGRDSEALG